MGDFWSFDRELLNRRALVVPGGGHITYGALSERADVWAAQFKRLTADQRCLVGLEFDIDPEAIAAYIGALRASYPVLIVEPGKLASGSRIDAVWRPEVLVSAGAANPILRHPLAENATEPHLDLRVLLSTSGSTGDPKLVRLSARNISSNAASIAEYLNLNPVDCAAVTLPFHYSYGLSVLNSYLAVGASLLLTRRSVIEPEFWHDARAAKATSLALVPHQVELLAHGDFTGAELPSLRYMTQAGGQLAPKQVHHFDAMARANDWQFFIMYGQTEAAPRISYVPPEALPEAAGTIGKAIPGGRIWLAADDGSEITIPGQPGELVYEGPNVMMGYATARTDFVRGHELAELRTGDIAERTGAGYFRIVGRMKRFVKLYGLRISLDQVEAFLCSREMPAQVVAVDDQLVVLLREPEGTAAVAALAAEYHLPSEAFHTGLLAETPLLSSGKPDHAALRRIAEETLATSVIARQQARSEEALADVLKRATRAVKVDSGDSFNSLGGDSLSYLQMQLLLEEQIGQAPLGWEDMSLAELEALVRDAGVPEGTRVHIGIDVPLRLAAIFLVVVQHATDYPLFGGTWMLIALMGFAMARFQLRQIATGNPLRLAIRLLYPIVPLYFILLLAYGTFRSSVPMSYLLLVGNYQVWPQGTLLEVYWFVSLYTQLVLALVLVTGVPVLRSAVVQHPWTSAALAAVGTVLALVGLVLWHDRVGLPYHPQRGFLECLSVFLLGWMLSGRQGPRQLTVTWFLAAATLGLLVQIGMSWIVSGLLLFTLVLLSLNPMVMVPRALGRSLTTLATLTLFVYLLHGIFVFFLLKMGLPQPLAAGLVLVLSFLGAMVTRQALDAFEPWSAVAVASWLRRVSSRSGRFARPEEDDPIRYRPQEASEAETNGNCRK
jgi:acyl-CoA synthetase (AMP-forming)/AMP-acid ligase II